MDKATRSSMWTDLAPLATVAGIAAFTVTALISHRSVAESNELKVCAASKELPYSSVTEDGFENKIAKAVAKAMGRKASFVWHERPSIYLVRDKLLNNECDVVIGLDHGDPRVLTTQPYYRAPYVFIQRKDSKLNIKTWQSPDLFKADKIGFVDGTPAAAMMQQLDLHSVHFNYMKSLLNFKSRRNQFIRVDPGRMVGEVASGKADVSVAFAPEVARYVKANPDLKLTVIPDNNFRSDGEIVRHHFDQAMGVRKNDTVLLKELNIAIEKAWPEIQNILEAEGIPLLELANRS